MIGYDQKYVDQTRFMARYLELHALAEKCGCDGMSGEWDGKGYGMQQSPAEIAGLVAAIEPYAPFGAMLDIGIGSGGTTRFMAEQLKPKHVWTIDNMAHPYTKKWALNRHEMPCPVTEIVGDSKDPETWAKLRETKVFFDLVGIDGYHTTDYVANDFKLILPQIYPGTIVWFHDIELPDVQMVWNKLMQAGFVIYRGNVKPGSMGIGAMVFMGSLGVK